jgi:hypothetical protein
MEGFSQYGKAGMRWFPNLDFEPQMDRMDADDERDGKVTLSSRPHPDVFICVYPIHLWLDF